MGANKNQLSSETPLVVGTIHSPASLRRALKLAPGAVDLLELRVDHFAENPEALLRAAPSLTAPLIVTVRRADEGGAAPLSSARRRDLYAQFFAVADFIDVELRSVQKLAETLAGARACKVSVILSDHYFRATPSLPRLRERLSAARLARADVFKVAANARTASELGTLLTFLAGEKKQALSVMGMGAFGRVSRLVFPRAGSVLNYGYLAEPQVSGQWEATVLKARIAEVMEE